MRRHACGRQDAENQILGFDHMTVGRHLLESWGLPQHFCLPVACHHDPGALACEDAQVLQISRILHLATLYVDLFCCGNQSPHLGLIDHFVRRYGYEGTLEVDTVGGRILAATRQIFPYFDLTLENESAYLEIVDRARAELINVSGGFIDQLLQQQQQIQMLRRQATHDGLTQLMNYQFFQETLGREIARARRSGMPLTIIMADIDRFKAVNDTHGHPAGDLAIQTVAEVMRSGLRDTDSIARYGGEEFSMILFNIQPQDAIIVADRIRQKISETIIAFDKRSFQLTMSFGIATLQPDENSTKEDLISRADKALYRAKSDGRNCCRIYQERLKCTAAAL
jgi:diguanylate cyclase (GGDEF)-like protein